LSERPFRHFQWDGKQLRLSCFIQPRASRDEIVGIHDNQLKIRLTSPPVDDAANTRLMNFLAKQFGVTRRQVELISGATSRRKIIIIDRPTKFPREASIRVLDQGSVDRPHSDQL